MEEDVSSAETAKIAPLRILVVDDEALLLLNLTDLIEELGHVPLSASSGAHALTLLANNGRVDLVITDQSMPEMKGTELAAALRQDWPALPVILASGYGETVEQAGLDLPCLPKPFTIADLQKAIASVAINPGR